MAKRPTALADLDIASEALAQQDGLAERLARSRERSPGSPPALAKPADQLSAGRAPTRDANAWRRGKSLLQVAIGEDAHVELSIIAKRRRMTLSQVLKSALDEWLASHGHDLRVS